MEEVSTAVAGPAPGRPVPPPVGRPDWRRPLRRMPAVLRRAGTLDGLAVAALAAGALSVATGLLPTADALATVGRTGPLLVFLVAVVVLAELTARAQVFDAVAVRIAILGRGRRWALFALLVTFATLTTIFLNLDTTAVLLTPVMLAVAARLGIAALPLAMTTVWLANTASLLLPVSNLTNLLAADRLGLPVAAFAGRMAAPQLVAVLATAACLWLLHWRQDAAARYPVPVPHRPADPVLFRVAAAACVLFVAGIVAGVTLAAVSVVCAVVVLVAFAVRDRAAIGWSLLPWRLPVLVTGLFLIVETVGRHGLSRLLAALVGTDPGPAGIGLAAAVGAVLANLLNNLPAYVAGEAVVPAGHTDQLLGLLVGVNVGPLVLPWASLATLLWLERCRAAGLAVPWRRFLLTGLVTAVVVLATAVPALLLTAG
ncbi:SLC13 family permease [Polymorphospora sp. NPDC050346]|uniref:SLC13 family permease n=1 Tax=Polymorphospora sp. NPDC050346 TaxID=3155780 RepID=UPI003409EA39